VSKLFSGGSSSNTNRALFGGGSNALSPASPGSSGGGARDLSNPGEYYAHFGVETNPLYNIQQTLGRLSGFSDPRFRALMNNVQAQLSAATAGQARISALRGARLGQDISSAIGSIGGGSTGVGAIARSLASSAASGASAETAAQGQMLGAQMTGQMGMDYLSQLMGLGTQAGTNIWSSAMGGWNQQSWTLNQLKGQREAMWNPMNILGSAAMSAGQLPWFQPKPTGKP